MAIYYVWSGGSGAGGTTWATAFTTLTTAFATEVAGDTLYVAHDHAESTAAAVTLTSSGTAANPTKIVCVNRAGSVPPVSADRRATATVTTTGANSINLNGCAHYDGIIFNAGSGAVSANLIVSGVSSVWNRLDNCSLRIPASAASGCLIQFGANSVGGTLVELNNTTVSFSSTSASHNIAVYGTLRWRNTPSALLNIIPPVLFMPNAVRGGSVECIGVDFSAAGAGKTIAGALGTAQPFPFRFIDCKLNAAATKSQVPLSHGSTEVDFIRSGATGVSYTVYRHRISGELMEEITIVRTGGASDGTTPIAWKVITTATCTYSLPFECPPIAIWNDTTGSARTATVEGIAATLPTDQEIWLELEYLGDAASPQGSFVNDAKADLLATAANQTSSAASWSGSTAPFKLAVTFTPQQKGWVYARVKCAKASSTFYIDPLVTLT